MCKPAYMVMRAEMRTDFIQNVSHIFRL